MRFEYYVKERAGRLLYLLDTDYKRHWACFNQYDEDRECKYKGFLFAGINSTTKFYFDAEERVIPSAPISSESLLNKFKVLENNPRFVASIQGRDPKNGLLGGAIRSSVDSNFFIGGAGLPELMGNLLIALSMYSFNLINRRHLRCATSYEYSYIQQACKEEGISEGRYYRVRCLIDDVMTSSF